MKVVKRAIHSAIAAMGFRLVRLEAEHASYANFKNLADAYELLLNETGDRAPIPPDEVRPKMLAQLTGLPPSEAYSIVEALARTAGLPGDVCEFGVAQGNTSALIANEIARSTKRLHLFDSFEGLPEPTEKDRLKDDVFSLGSMEAYAGQMALPETLVKARLEALSFPPDRYVVHKGFIKESLRDNRNLPRRVSFAFVDFDFYEPIRIALEFLDGVAGPGAVIVVDDYDYFSTGAKAAVDEFVEEKNSPSPAYDLYIPDTRLGHFAILTRQAATEAA